MGNQHIAWMDGETSVHTSQISGPGTPKHYLPVHFVITKQPLKVLFSKIFITSYTFGKIPKQWQGKYISTRSTTWNINLHNLLKARDQ